MPVKAKSNRGRGGVNAVFLSYPRQTRAKLQRLRALIQDTARRTKGVGAIQEALKWGQPSFLTPSGSGSTIRIAPLKDRPGGSAMYFRCQTNLVSTFRQIYAKDFEFEGSRAILFNAEKPIPEAPLRHCIALALTYHATKRKSV